MGSIMRQRFEQEKKKMIYVCCGIVIAVVAVMVGILNAFLNLNASANKVQEMHYKCFDIDFHNKATLLCGEKNKIEYEENWVQFPDLISNSTITLMPPFVSFECSSAQECEKKAIDWRNNVGLTVEREGDK